MGNISKKPSLSDAMVVVGLTIFILTLFLTISFRDRSEELCVKKLEALQNTMASLENFLKNDIESLKVVRLQILSRSSNVTQSIPSLLKKSESSFASNNNGFGIPYYLRVGKETLLMSARGRIATPECSLGRMQIMHLRLNHEKSYSLLESIDGYADEKLCSLTNLAQFKILKGNVDSASQYIQTGSQFLEDSKSDIYKTLFHFAKALIAIDQAGLKLKDDFIVKKYFQKHLVIFGTPSSKPQFLL